MSAVEDIYKKALARACKSLSEITQIRADIWEKEFLDSVLEDMKTDTCSCGVSLSPCYAESHTEKTLRDIIMSFEYP